MITGVLDTSAKHARNAALPGRALATAGGFLISPGSSGRVGEMPRLFLGIQRGQITGLCDDVQIQELCGLMARMRLKVRASQSFRVRAARHPRGLAPSNHTFTRPSRSRRVETSLWKRRRDLGEIRTMSIGSQLTVGVVTRAGLAKRNCTWAIS